MNWKKQKGFLDGPPTPLAVNLTRSMLLWWERQEFCSLAKGRLYILGFLIQPKRDTGRLSEQDSCEARDRARHLTSFHLQANCVIVATSPFPSFPGLSVPICKIKDGIASELPEKSCHLQRP